MYACVCVCEGSLSPSTADGGLQADSFLRRRLCDPEGHSVQVTDPHLHVLQHPYFLTWVTNICVTTAYTCSLHEEILQTSSD